MKLRRINEAELTAPKVNSSSYAGADSGAKGMKFEPAEKREEPVAQTADAKQVQNATKKTGGTASPVTRTVSETLLLVKEIVRENINNTLGNLKNRERLGKKRRRPLASTTVYGKYKTMREEKDEAEETEVRDEKNVEKTQVKSTDNKVEKRVTRRKVPGPNLAPENLSIN